MEVPAGVSEIDRGVQHIRGMDASFDPDGFVEFARAAFADVQEGIARRDLTAVQDRLTPQEYARLQAQCDQLRSTRRTNRIERIRIGQAQVTEAWQPHPRRPSRTSPQPRFVDSAAGYDPVRKG